MLEPKRVLPKVAGRAQLSKIVFYAVALTVPFSGNTSTQSFEGVSSYHWPYSVTGAMARAFITCYLKRLTKVPGIPAINSPL